MKKKILVIGMGTSAFGLEKQTVEVFKFIENVEPYFLISKYEDGSVSKLLKDNNIKFEHVPTGYIGRYNLIWTLITVVQIPILYTKILLAFFKNHCQSILILNTHPVINALLTFWILKFTKKIPIIFYFHNVHGYSFFSKVVYRSVDYLSSKIIAVSSSIKNELLENGIKENKVIVVHNGIDINKFGAKRDPKICKKLNVNSNNFVVGFSGQLNVEKGIFDIIDSAKILLEQNKNFKYIIVGKKNDNYLRFIDYINRLNLSNYFIFTDWVNNIEDFYPFFDVLVVPSLMSEGLPLVNIEAMACSVPAVTTKMGGLKELIIDGETGYFVENSNPQQIADSILKIVNNKNLARKMGQAARLRVEEHFDIEKNAKVIEKILLN